MGVERLADVFVCPSDQAAERWLSRRLKIQ
jgi:hypothetical protein